MSTEPVEPIKEDDDEPLFVDGAPMNKAARDEVRSNILKLRELTNRDYQAGIERAIQKMKPRCSACAEMLHRYVRLIEVAHHLNTQGNHEHDPPLQQVAAGAEK